MKNFKDKNLYESESELFDAIIEDMVETNTEYNKVGGNHVGKEEDDDSEERLSSKVQQLFPDSPIDTSGNVIEFGEGLLEVFKEHNKYKGQIPRKRSELLPAYAAYLPSNVKDFANCTDIGEATVDLLTKDKGLPVLMGMKDNEYPYVIDLEDNTSGVIVGGAGSGKSWLTFQMMTNLMTLNTPEELNFLILDAQDTAMWKQFAKSPHVLGYHTNIHTYLDILAEVQKEHIRRAWYLSSIGVEDFKTYREMCKDHGDYDELAKHPYLVVVLDESTFTMKQLRQHDKDAYDEFRDTLVSLSTVVRSTGIRILAIGQRAVDQSIPKDYMANASMRFAMKMDSDTEFDIMFHNGWENHVSRKPDNDGESLMIELGQTYPQYVKTLIPGGTSAKTMLQLIRVISLDWVRRTIGSDIDYTKPPEFMEETIVKGFNRHNYYTDSLRDLHEGRILTNNEVNEGAQVDIDPEESGNTEGK